MMSLFNAQNLKHPYSTSENHHYICPRAFGYTLVHTIVIPVSYPRHGKLLNTLTLKEVKRKVYRR